MPTRPANDHARGHLAILRFALTETRAPRFLVLEDDLLLNRHLHHNVIRWSPFPGASFATLYDPRPAPARPRARSRRRRPLPRRSAPFGSTPRPSSSTTGRLSTLVRPLARGHLLRPRLARSRKSQISSRPQQPLSVATFGAVQMISTKCKARFCISSLISTAFRRESVSTW